MWNFFSTSSGIGLILSSIIFLIAIVLVALKKIGFWQTFLFLVFSLIVGVTVGNFGFLKEYAHNKKLKEFQDRLQLMQEDIKKLKEQQEEKPQNPSSLQKLSELDNEH